MRVQTGDSEHRAGHPIQSRIQRHGADEVEDLVEHLPRARVQIVLVFELPVIHPVRLIEHVRIVELEQTGATGKDEKATGAKLEDAAFPSFRGQLFERGFHRVGEGSKSPILGNGYGFLLKHGALVGGSSHRTTKALLARPQGFGKSRFSTGYPTLRHGLLLGHGCPHPAHSLCLLAVTMPPGPVLLTNDLAFPHPSWATEEGLIAVGGDLRPERLVLAYASGIFPWPHEGMPLLWFCPDPRMVLVPKDLHVSRSLGKVMRNKPLRVTLDRDFEQVIAACARTPRAHERGTWITRAMIDAYTKLHHLGLAHSVEVWQQQTLAGGLYGVSLGAAFFGESMFTRVPSASKVAFVTLVQQLARWRFHFVDCQMHTPHLARFGAQPWPRVRFLEALASALREPTRRGAWQLDDAPKDGSQ